MTQRNLTVPSLWLDTYAFELLPAAVKMQEGTLKGSFRNAATGAPLTGSIHVALDKRVSADAEGIFSLKLPVGRHDVLVSLSGFVTQQKRIRIRAGEVVIIFNLDLVASE